MERGPHPEKISYSVHLRLSQVRHFIEGGHKLSAVLNEVGLFCRHRYWVFHVFPPSVSVVSLFRLTATFYHTRDKMVSKRFYYTPKDPANDPPVDPDFAADCEDEFIETENDEIVGSQVHGWVSPEARGRFLAYLKANPLPELDRTFGRKAE